MARAWLVNRLSRERRNGHALAALLAPQAALVVRHVPFGLDARIVVREVQNYVGALALEQHSDVFQPVADDRVLIVIIRQPEKERDFAVR